MLSEQLSQVSHHAACTPPSCPRTRRMCLHSSCRSLSLGGAQVHVGTTPGPTLSLHYGLKRGGVAPCLCQPREFISQEPPGGHNTHHRVTRGGARSSVTAHFTRAQHTPRSRLAAYISQEPPGGHDTQISLEGDGGEPEHTTHSGDRGRSNSSSSRVRARPIALRAPQPQQAGKSSSSRARPQHRPWLGHSISGTCCA